MSISPWLPMSSTHTAHASKGIAQLLFLSFELCLPFKLRLTFPTTSESCLLLLCWPRWRFLYLGAFPSACIIQAINLAYAAYSDLDLMDVEGNTIKTSF
jgi:hypothetical protein